MAEALVCVKTGTGTVEMTTLPLPSPGPGQALVKTRLTTICGSDIHIVDELPIPAGTPMGHEAVGEIVEVGAGVTTVTPGDRVVSSCLATCGTCARCQDGDHQVCEGFMAPMNLLFGAQGSHYLVNQADLNVAKIPDGLDDEGAIFASDIMSTGFAAIERAELRFGDTVAIFAQGPVGLCATAAARLRGAGLIVAVESIPERVEMSKRFGADHVVEPKNAVDQIRAIVGFAGVDVAVECLGNQKTLEAACQVTRFGGTVSSVGVYGAFPTVSIPTDGSFLHRRFVSTLCPIGSERLRRMMRLVETGKVDLRPMLTHRMKLEETPKGYDLFRERKDGVMKIAITP